MAILLQNSFSPRWRHESSPAQRPPSLYSYKLDLNIANYLRLIHGLAKWGGFMEFWEYISLGPGDSTGRPGPGSIIPAPDEYITRTIYCGRPTLPFPPSLGTLHCLFSYSVNRIVPFSLCFQCRSEGDSWSVMWLRPATGPVGRSGRSGRSGRRDGTPQCTGQYPVHPRPRILG